MKSNIIKEHSNEVENPLLRVGAVMYSALGWLLHLSNRDIPFLAKEQFYAMKTRILKKYGTFIGYEMQHIKKECYSCESTGVFKCDWKMAEICWSCGGSGVYQEFWTRLEKWKLGKFYFHNPIKKQYTYEPLFEGEALPIIEGYITHKQPKYRLGREAALWLFLFFDRKTFVKEIGRVCCPTHKRTPLVIIGNLIWLLRNFDIKDYLPKKKVKYDYSCDTDDLPF